MFKAKFELASTTKFRILLPLLFASTVILWMRLAWGTGRHRCRTAASKQSPPSGCFRCISERLKQFGKFSLSLSSEVAVPFFTPPWHLRVARTCCDHWSAVATCSEIIYAIFPRRIGGAGLETARNRAKRTIWHSRRCKG